MNMRPLIESMKVRGLSQRKMVETLNASRTPAPKGSEWGLSQRQRLISRLDLY